MNDNRGLLQGLRKSTYGRHVLGLLIGLFMVGGMSGCYGRFPLTNAIYRWNGRITNNHVVNSIIMIVLAIIPVYWLAIVVDAIIINSIEFWDGNRMDISQTYEQPDGTTVVFAPGKTPDEAVLTASKDGAIVVQRTYRREGLGVTSVLDEKGAVVSRVTKDGKGGFIFTDAAGDRTGALSAAEVADLRSGKGGGMKIMQAAMQ